MTDETPAADESPAAETPADETPADETPADETPAEQTPDAATVEIRNGQPVRAGRGSRRVSAAGAVIGLLLGLLGFALVVQLRGNTADAQLNAARPDDLVRILSDLDARQDRLRQEIADLQERRRQLDSGAQGQEAAVAEARRRADELGILAGTLPAEGPGLSIRMVPGGEPVRAATLLDAVQELRGAGAEAMQIRGSGSAVVRVVASTYFVDASPGVLVDGVALTAPYTIEVIGDPQTMQTAMNIPGGVVDTVRQHDGTVSVSSGGTVEVTALHRGGALKYARPTS